MQTIKDYTLCAIHTGKRGNVHYIQEVSVHCIQR